MGWLFLAVATVGLLFTLSALRPVRLPNVLAIPSFFAGWLTNELIVHHLVWQGLATLVFVSLGALDTWPGWVALVVVALQWAGNLVVIRDIRATPATIDAALEELDGEVPAPAGPIRWQGLVVPFWFRQPAVVRDRDRTFARVAGRELQLDVYRARDHRDGERRPVVLYLHGGAWIISNKDEQGRPLMNHLVPRGWVGVNADYRLSPWARFPDHLVDAKRAVAWIREHADEIGADPSFIAVVGGSAGGHLAALTSLTADRRDLQPGFEDADTSVQACVPFYGVFDVQEGEHTLADFVDFFGRHVMQAFPDEDPERWRLASPVELVDAGVPPTFLVHGALDTLAPAPVAARYADLLRDAGVPVAHAELPGTQHAFDVFPSIRTAMVLQGVESFLGWARARHLAELGSDDERTGAGA